MNPAVLFTLLSLLFGSVTIALAPPLRGPDEGAHFVRAYAIALGEIIPRRTDAHGRRGTFLPAGIHDDLAFFEEARQRERGNYRAVMGDHAGWRADRPALDRGAVPVFVLYGGSEGYSPIPYLPHVVAAWAAKLAGLDFLPTLYLMRFSGLLAATAVTAYAISRTPHLRWAFLLIAMLPSSLYGRSVISADGAVLSCTLVVLALCLGAAAQRTGRALPRSIWMTLCILTKPSQIAMVLLEAMVRPLRDLRRQWRAAALVVLPGLILTPLWVVSVGGEMAAWRLYEGTDVAPQEFNALWKLKFMLENPLHFPAALVTSLDFSAELWRQMIGVLGWLDTRLQSWTYPIVSALLIVAGLERLPLDAATRVRVAAVAGITALAYCLLVFLIFYLTSTPAEADRVRGVQGRYFVVALPLLAIVLAALLPRAPRRGWTTGAALSGAALSGLAVCEAILRTDWP